MHRHTRYQRPTRRGQAVLLICILSVLMLGMAGLAVDLVLAYAAKAQLTLAIDSVSLSAMRALERGESYSEQGAEVTRIADLMLSANFPTGQLLGKQIHFSTSPKIYGPSIPAGAGSVFVQDSSVPPGVRELRVAGEVTIPTLFMRIFGQNSLTIRSSATAARQDVNLALVIDRSGSLANAGVWDDVQAASKAFLDYFDNNSDRLGLISFATSANVDYPIGPGFKTNNTTSNLIDSMQSKGGTNSALGLWLAYGELLRLGDPNALNVIVFFTDGQPTALPASWNVRGTGNPKYGNSDNPTCSSTNKTAVVQAFSCGSTPCDAGGLNQLIAGPPPVKPGSNDDLVLVSGCNKLSNGSQALNVEYLWDETRGLPTQWSAVYDASMGCVGCTSIARTFQITTGPYSAYSAFQSDMFSSYSPSYSSGQTRANRIIGASRNLALNVAQSAQSDAALGAGAVVYAIGLGSATVSSNEDFLLRVANDEDSPSFTSARPQGDFIFAPTVNDLQSAFDKVRSHVIRLTR